MKRHLVMTLLLLMIMSVGVYAVPSYTGAADDAKDSSVATEVSTTLDIEAELGLIWGYDTNTGNSGFREVIDLDLLWEINPFQTYTSDTSELEYNEPQGVAMVSGGHLLLKVNDQQGDLDANDPANISINYENIYGRVLLDPFYVHLAGSSQGNHFTRINGYSFMKSTSRLQANWAHMGYRVQWAGIVSTGFWGLSGPADKIKNEGSEAFLGLGYVGNLSEMMVAVGSPADWTSNDGVYDIGYSIESNPIGFLLVNAGVRTGVGYDVTPLGFGTSFGYRQDLTSTLTLVPYLGVDGSFSGTESEPFENLATEIIGGISVEWPGSTGWGYDPLANRESNRFSGFDVSVSYYTPGNADPTPVTSLAMSTFEDGVSGLIPKLGVSGVFELYDVTQAAGDMYSTYGVYLDYAIQGQYNPYVRLRKTDPLQDGALSFEGGVEVTVIPNTKIVPRYETASLNDLDNDSGLFSIEAIVSLY